MEIKKIKKEARGLSKRLSGVYLLTIQNKDEVKFYVGASSCLRTRLMNHFCKNNPNKELRALMENEGTDFEYEILEYCDTKELVKREAFWVEFYKQNFPQFTLNQLRPGGETFINLCPDLESRKESVCGVYHLMTDKNQHYVGASQDIVFALRKIVANKNNNKLNKAVRSSENIFIRLLEETSIEGLLEAQERHINNLKPTLNSNKQNILEAAQAARIRILETGTNKRPVIQLTKPRKGYKGLQHVAYWESVSNASEYLGIVSPNIIACANGRRKSAGGFSWEWAQ